MKEIIFYPQDNVEIPNDAKYEYTICNDDQREIVYRLGDTLYIVVENVVYEHCYFN